MSKDQSPSDPHPQKRLAELALARKAARQSTPGVSNGGHRQSERAAAAASASKSKPAMRK